MVEHYGQAGDVLDLGIFTLPIVEERDAKTLTQLPLAWARGYLRRIWSACTTG
ncbi:MAG: hypothetical protein KGZ92_10835 [Firmicutes bacterium]|nr:hypothetical protein [Dethiobacter sp.]MBS3889763.1 hypothetical protein [Bacillota bacterium]MBS4054904.1 hypothetical protein [Thermaerobacter sp.]